MEVTEQHEESQKPFVVEPQNGMQAGKKRGPKVSPAVDGTEMPVAKDPSPQPERGKIPPKPKRNMAPIEFFQYWASIPEREREEWFVVYIYRGLPVCDITQTMSEEELRSIAKREKKKPQIYQARLTKPIDPANWQQEMLDRFGAGDYGLRLNDQHPSVKPNTICYATIDKDTGGMGFRNWDSYPPVLNLAEVVLTDEANAPYVRWARLRGIQFPHDPDYAVNSENLRGEEEMAASVVDTMARQVEGLTNKVVSMAEKQSAASAANAPTDPAAKSELAGILAGIANANRGAEIGMDFMSKSFGKIIENQAKAADPTEHLKGVVEVAKLLQPPAGNGNSDLLKIMELQITQQREQAKQQLDQQDKSFTRLIESERENHKAIVQMLTSRLDSLEKQESEAPASKEEDALKTYQRIRAIVRDLEEEEAPANDGPAWLAPVLSLGEKAISGIAETTRNLAAMRANQSPMATVEDPAQGLPPAAPPPPETPQDKEMNMKREYAKIIHRPLVDAIKAGRMGYEFAAGFISEAGQPAYDALVSNGYDGVTRFLQAYPPLWKELTLPPIGGVATDKFLREFLDKAKVMEAMQMAKGQPVRKGPTVNQ